VRFANTWSGETRYALDTGNRSDGIELAGLGQRGRSNVVGVERWEIRGMVEPMGALD